MILAPGGLEETKAGLVTAQRDWRRRQWAVSCIIVMAIGGDEMSWTRVIWDPTPGGNVEHVEEHGLEPEEVDHVLLNYQSSGTSQTSGRMCVFGYTPDGRYIIVVYEEVDDETVMPWTAYEVAEP